MATKYLAILACFPLLYLAACSSTAENKQLKLDDASMVADTIFYPVRIKNIDPDDEWADNRLAKLNRKQLVDGIFDAVYAGTSIPYNYLTDAPMTIDDIKAMEEKDDFSRDNVIELEFREKWWYSADQSRFEKQILSVLVAYAVFDDEGNLRGMKAAFYVKNRND